MRILFMSTLYSTPRQPGMSPGNTRIVRRLRRHAEVEVVVPVRWVPAPLAERIPALRLAAAVPAEETDEDGAMVRHPRMLHIPGVGRALYAGLYAASLYPVLKDIVRRFRPQVLLCANGYPDGTAAVALGALLGLPVVVRVMGSDINTVATLPGRRAQIAWAMRHSARVIAVSESLRAAVRALGVDGDRVATVPTGVDLARFRPGDREAARRSLGLGGAPVVLVPARLSAEKGIPHLLEALKTLEPGRWRLLLVGDGKERRTLEEKTRALGLEGAVRFEGFQPEERMPLYYTAADLVCLPSFAEGWPDVLMESFACGCPVVASRVGGIPDILSLTGAGLLITPGDVPELAATLRLALARDWDRPAIAAAMTPHTLDRTAERYLEICATAPAFARYLAPS
jgi:glycosyltransferase involved in cell wall biosynthesis